MPFNNSFKPGKKDFDFYIDQVSYSPQRAQGGRLLEARTTSSTSPSSAARARRSRRAQSIAGLKKYKLGAQIGTTSYEYIVDEIKPSSKPRVYDTNDAAVAALKNGQIDGLVVDLPTAFYVTARAGRRTGRSSASFASTGTKEHFGLVLQKGSPLDRVRRTRRSTGSGRTARSRTLAAASGSRKATGAPDPEVAPLDGSRSSRILGGATVRVSREARTVAIALALDASSSSAVVVVVVTRSPGWGAFKAYFFDWDDLQGVASPRSLDAFWLNVKLFLHRRGRSSSSPRCCSRCCAALPGPVFFPSRARDRLHRPLPRHPDDPRDLACSASGCPALGLSGVPTLAVLLGRRRARARLHGVRLRGLPRRDRVGAPEPGRGRPLARALARAGAALRRRPAGGAARDPAAPQRLHRAAEGHGARRRRSGVVEAFRQAQIDQSATFNFTPYLVAALLFVADHDPARALDRLARRARPAAARTAGRRRR